MGIKIHPREILLLETEQGRFPFLEWLASLKDVSIERSIDARLTRIQDGNFGDHKSVGKGVFEISKRKNFGRSI
jgi:putative addiction module killer protein